MSFSELPPPPEVEPGQDLPELRTRPPGPQSRTWLLRLSRTAAPMGPAPGFDPLRGIHSEARPWTIVYATAKGCNVLDVDGNRYVDLAAGFGAQLLGHAHPRIQKVIELQAARLLQALGDLHPADATIALMERLAKLHPAASARVILGLTGADAVTAALKTAMLCTGRPGVLAFEGAYHGLGYGPLRACGLRPGYREPFSPQLGTPARFLPYPASADAAEQALEQARFELARGDIGALLFEPILGRGGVVVPPEGFLAEVCAMARTAGALVVADEIWTALGRAGSWLASHEHGPDLVCLGKGLGGGLPISACIGSDRVMSAWRRDPEVVHTSTFSGAPLSAATAIATLDVLKRDDLVARSARVGAAFREQLARRFVGRKPVRDVRGSGLMIGIDSSEPGSASRWCRRLLERGYITTTGGGDRDVLVLTPPLDISERLLTAFCDAFDECL